MYNKPAYKKQPTDSTRNTKLVDFTTLSPKDLLDLERKWSSAAMRLEFKLESSVRFNKPASEIKTLQDSANKFWGRVRAVYKYRKTR